MTGRGQRNAAKHGGDRPNALCRFYDDDRYWGAKLPKRAGHFSKKYNDCGALLGVQPQPNHIVFVDFLCLSSGHHYFSKQIQSSRSSLRLFQPILVALLCTAIAQQRDVFNPWLKNAVEHATQLIAELNTATAEPFSSRIAMWSPRFVGALQKITKVLRDAGATTRIVRDKQQVALGLEDVVRLSGRFAEVEVTDEELALDGVLLGILPDLHELQLPEGGTLKRAVVEDLAFNDLPDQAFEEQFLRKPALAYVTVTKTLRRGQVVGQQPLLERLEKPSA